MAPNANKISRLFEDPRQGRECGCTGNRRLTATEPTPGLPAPKPRSATLGIVPSGITRSSMAGVKNRIQTPKTKRKTTNKSRNCRKSVGWEEGGSGKAPSPGSIPPILDPCQPNAALAVFRLAGQNPPSFEFDSSSFTVFTGENRGPGTSVERRTATETLAPQRSMQQATCHSWQLQNAIEILAGP